MVCPAVPSRIAPAEAPTAISAPRRETASLWVGASCGSVGSCSGHVRRGGASSAAGSTGRARQNPTMRGSLTATWSTTLPTRSQASTKCTRRNEKSNAYHCAMFMTPIVTSTSAEPTSRPMDARSRRERGPVTGGHVNSRGYTAHSLPSRTGIIASPASTWAPWVTRYSPRGRGDSGNQAGGLCSTWL